MQSIFQRFFIVAVGALLVFSSNCFIEDWNVVFIPFQIVGLLVGFCSSKKGESISNGALFGCTCALSFFLTLIDSFNSFPNDTGSYIFGFIFCFFSGIFGLIVAFVGNFIRHEVIV